MSHEKSPKKDKPIKDDKRQTPFIHGYTEPEEEIISKTAVKKECLALQELGEALTELKDDLLARIPLEEPLLSTIIETRRITKNGAKKRHMQFIGKLMRAAEHEAINEAYQAIVDEQQNDARQLHIVESWRDRLLDSNDNEALADFFNAYPHADRQQIRQLSKNAQAERAKNKTPTSARKLFRLLRETLKSLDA